MHSVKLVHNSTFPQITSHVSTLYKEGSHFAPKLHKLRRFSLRNFLKCSIISTLSVPDILSVWLYSPSDLSRFFSFLFLYTAGRVGRTTWKADQSIARPLPTHRATQTQNRRIQISIPRVGFETTIPVFEGAKMVHDLDIAATVIDPGISRLILFSSHLQFISSLRLRESVSHLYNKNCIGLCSAPFIVPLLLPFPESTCLLVTLLGLRLLERYLWRFYLQGYERCVFR
jgi:hypothetical protein